MRESFVKPGMRIVITDIKTTRGYNVDKEHIANRCLHARGTVLGYISGHGGEVFAVEHDVGTIAVYHHSEFERIIGMDVHEQIAAVLKETNARPDDWVVALTKKALEEGNPAFLLFSENGRRLIEEHTREELLRVMRDIKR